MRPAGLLAAGALPAPCNSGSYSIYSMHGQTAYVLYVTSSPLSAHTMPGMAGLLAQLVLAAPRLVVLANHLYTLPLVASTKCVALLEMTPR